MEAAEAAVRRAQDDLAACDLIFAEDRLASLRVVRHPEGGAEENAEENDGYFFVPHDEEGSLDRVRCTHEYLKHGNVKVVARAWSDAVRAALRRGAGRLVVRSSDADDGSDCVDIVLVDPLFPPDAFRDAPPPRPAGAAGRHGRTVTLTTKLSPRGGAWDQVWSFGMSASPPPERTWGGLRRRLRRGEPSAGVCCRDHMEMHGDSMGIYGLLEKGFHELP